jgi:enoyl-CoA hydratase
MISYKISDNIAIIELNDGKANVFNPQTSQALGSALKQAEKEATAVIVCGSNGQFSGGFDLKVMQSGDPAAMAGMIIAGFKMLQQLAAHPQPTIAACTGNALGLGAFLLLVSDYRIAAQGKYIVGLPETAGSMFFTKNLVVAAQARLNPRHYVRAALQSEFYSPSDAVEAGFIDTVVAAQELHEVALEKAQALSKLPPKFYARNKQDLLGDTLRTMQSHLDEIIANPAKNML